MKQHKKWSMLLCVMLDDLSLISMFVISILSIHLTASHTPKVLGVPMLRISKSVCTSTHLVLIYGTAMAHDIMSHKKVDMEM